jgi:hypothetical protein
MSDAATFGDGCTHTCKGPSRRELLRIAPEAVPASVAKLIIDGRPIKELF